jgi:hypothetical protein
MQNITQKRMISEGARNKTGFSGFTFKHSVGDKYLKEIAEVDRIKYGTVEDSFFDGATLSRVTLDNSKTFPVMFNRKNFRKILRDHGYFNSADIVVTANEFEEGIFLKGIEGKPDKINLFKDTEGGCFVIGANRFNGYGVVTFFEQYDADQKRQYLATIRKRGMPFRSLEGGGSSSIASGEVNPGGRVPASLPGVRADGN